MNYYFYCPKCGHEDRIDKLPRGTVGNIRDGFGTPIHHYECPKCHNLDAGYMTYNLLEGSLEDMEDYFRDIIGIYQGIRGIKDCKAIFESLVDYMNDPDRKKAYEQITENCATVDQDGRFKAYIRYIHSLERKLSKIADMASKGELQVKNYKQG